jgi:hypothetical protein
VGHAHLYLDHDIRSLAVKDGMGVRLISCNQKDLDAQLTVPIQVGQIGNAGLNVFMAHRSNCLETVGTAWPTHQRRHL